MTTSPDNLEYKRHSLAHILAMAVLAKYPDAKLGVGPAIDNGFYYDFELPEKLTDDGLKEIQKTMRKLVQQGLDFAQDKWSMDEAVKYFKDQPMKLELIKEKSDGKEVQVYKSNTFIDFCKGGHVENTKDIDPKSFKLSHVAGAYWKGDEKNTMLTRIYGLAFDTAKELADYEAQLEEAKKRDHRKLGAELDLFMFSEKVGPGLPLWTPRGTMLRDLLDDFVWQLRKKKGFQKVEIPHITKKDLFETSGHWEKFEDELFKIETREGHTFAMKPMNCPFHTQIYANKLRSYRELPIRYSNTTMCYRDEQTGELNGLSRVRAFTQDDAHTFCRATQVKDEMFAIWDIVEAFYSAFGFDLEVRLSLHDPDSPDKYLGEPEQWKKAEDTMRKLVKERDVFATETPGEAAFYGPKIDFMAKDSLGREWQVATIQLDFNMPARFSLSCINEKGEEEGIYMLHAAIMGSIERFLSILIEHYAGHFPVWLAPEQARFIPISKTHTKYCEEAADKLRKKGVRVAVDATPESMGKRIRNAQLEKVPYILVAGDKEVEADTVSIRFRGEDKGPRHVDEFIKRLQKEIKDKVSE